jgi:TnpA family transposase
MRFVTPVRTVNAGPNRKYFGAERGITYYIFTSDQYAGFHGLVIPGTLRDSIYILAGLLEQSTSLQPAEIMTDTTGASNVVFGLFWLLGYQLRSAVESDPGHRGPGPHPQDDPFAELPGRRDLRLRSRGP